MADSPISALTQVSGDLPNAAWLVADDLGVTKKLSQTQLLITELKSPLTLASTCKLQIYDTDNALYRDFITGTAGVTPRLDIAAPAGGEIFIDGATIGSTTAANATFNIATVNTDLNLANGCFIKSGTSNNDEFFIQAYDVDGSSYVTFMTVTSNNTPNLSIATPAGATMSINGAVIGDISPADASFTNVTMSNNGEIRSTTTAGHTYAIAAYDTDDLVYRYALQVTAGTNPTFEIGGPNMAGTADSLTIGSSNPAPATVTLLSVNNDIIFPYQGAVVSVDATGTYTAITNLATPRTVTLLSADAIISGKTRIIFDAVGTAGTNNITVATQGSETINGAATYTINTDYGYVAVVSDGTNWVVQNKVYVEADPLFTVQSTAVSANATANLVKVTDNSAARTITLLSADAAISGTIRIIKDADGTAGSSNNITIDTQGAETIDTAASQTIVANYGCLRVVSDGSNWWTF